MRKMALFAVMLLCGMRLGAQSAEGWACGRVVQGDQSGLPAPPPLPPAPTIAGQWEAADGRRGEVGIQIEVQTRPQEFPNSPLKAEEIDGQGVSFCLYARKGVDENPFERNCFGYNHGGWEHTGWDGQHLTIDFSPAMPSRVTPGIRLDLKWDEKAATWSGQFERGDFRGDVILQRPAPAANAVVNPFVGTWYHESPLAVHPMPARTVYAERPGLTSFPAVNQCLHVAEDAESALSGWEDSIQVPSNQRFVVNGVAQPVPAPRGTYGAPVKVTQPASDTIVVDRLAFVGMISGAYRPPPRLTISADGKTLTSSEMEAPRIGEPGIPMTWTRVGRVPGDMCPQ